MFGQTDRSINEWMDKRQNHKMDGGTDRRMEENLLHNKKQKIVKLEPLIARNISIYADNRTGNVRKNLQFLLDQ